VHIRAADRTLLSDRQPSFAPPGLLLFFFSRRPPTTHGVSARGLRSFAPSGLLIACPAPLLRRHSPNPRRQNLTTANPHRQRPVPAHPQRGAAAAPPPLPERHLSSPRSKAARQPKPLQPPPAPRSSNRAGRRRRRPHRHRRNVTLRRGQDAVKGAAPTSAGAILLLLLRLPELLSTCRSIARLSDLHIVNPCESRRDGPRQTKPH